MQARKLGNSSLEVSALGLGCMDLSPLWSGVDKQEAIALLRTAVERGVTFFDTAEVYGPFVNEEVGGRSAGAFPQPGGYRHQVRLQPGPNRSHKPGWVEQPAAAHQAGSRRVAQKRLKVDAIDLFYQHRVDPTVPIEEVAGAVKDLIQQGKVRHLGLSEPGPRDHPPGRRV